jgi:hypothetical protein
VIAARVGAKQPSGYDARDLLIGESDRENHRLMAKESY